MTVTIKCRACRKFRRIEAPKKRSHESSRTLAVCRATNNVLVILDAAGKEIFRPTANDVLFNRIQPDAGCPQIVEARREGTVMMAEYSIAGDGTGRQWLQDVIY
jgi:hypothetical protein